MAAVLAVLLAVFAPPVLAQGTPEGKSPVGKSEARAVEPGAPPPPEPPEYAVAPDGRIIVGGDVVIDCSFPPPGFGEQLCAERDSLPSGPSLPPGGPEAEAKAAPKGLPRTGGVGATLLALSTGVLLVGGGLLVHRIFR